MLSNTTLATSLDQWPLEWNVLLAELNKSGAQTTKNFWKSIVTSYVTSTPLKDDTEAAYQEYFHQFWINGMPKLNKNPMAIHEAADRGYDVYIKNILEKVPLEERPKLLDRKAANADTALHIASGNGHIAVVKELLENQANANAVGEFRETPLHRAAYSNHVDVAKLLLAHNASCEASRNDMYKPIHVAAMMGSSEVIEALVQHDKNQLTLPEREGRTALFTAAVSQNMGALNTLLKNGGDINKVNTLSNQTLLHWAASKNNIELMKWLLDHNANVDAPDTSKFTPLQRVAMQSIPSLEAAEILVKKGANVNVGPQTPLYLLATQASQSSAETTVVAEYLIEKGADVNIKCEGKTPLEALKERKLLPKQNKLLDLLKKLTPQKGKKSFLKW